MFPKAPIDKGVGLFECFVLDEQRRLALWGVAVRICTVGCAQEPTDLVDGGGASFGELHWLVLGGRGTDNVKTSLGVKLLKGVGGLGVAFVACHYSRCLCLDRLALLCHAFGAAVNQSRLTMAAAVVACAVVQIMISISMSICAQPRTMYTV